MTWRTIASTETDPGAPFTSELAKAYANNFGGLAEGAAGAPKIRTVALQPPAAGTANLIFRLQDAEITTTAAPYEDVGLNNRAFSDRHLGVTALVAGTITCSVDHRRVGSIGNANVRVIKNGTLVQEWSTTSGTFVTRQVNVPVAVGDAVIFQQQAEVQGEDAAWRNLRIYSATPDMAVA